MYYIYYAISETSRNRYNFMLLVADFLLEQELFTLPEHLSSPPGVE